MTRNPVLDLPLTSVMRPEIALPLQQILRLYTVGCFLKAWRNPRLQKNIEQIFDSPRQARHAAAVCATWLGMSMPMTGEAVPAWWLHDERVSISA